MDEICRICVNNVDKTNAVNIFYEIQGRKKSVSDIITECTSIQILDSDMLPKNICFNCCEQLIVLSDFRQLIVKSDIQLKEYVLLDSKINGTTETNFEGADINPLTIEICSSANDDIENNLEIKTECLDISEDILDDRIDETNCSQSDEQFKDSGETNEKDSKNSLKVDSSKGKRKRKKNKVHEFTCSICEKVVRGGVNRLKEHMFIVHTDIKPHSCKTCNKRFKTKPLLRYHTMVHTGEKPYQCEFCLERFPTPQTVFQHKKKKHIGSDKKHKCDSCENRYSSPGELEIHRRKAHTGETPFLCEFCSKRFVSGPSLRFHIAVVHEKDKKCPVCKVMLSRYLIKGHLQKHKDRAEGNRRFVCQVCGKRFFAAEGLRVHERIHTGERPHTCEICGKSFNQKAGFNTHKRVHSEVRAYACELCPKLYKNKRELQMHLKNKHPDRSKPDLNI